MPVSFRGTLLRFFSFLFLFTTVHLVAQETAAVTAFASFPGASVQVIQAGDGNFYLATFENKIVQVTPAGLATTLATIPNDDCGLAFGLIEGSDGNFYGECLEGGVNGGGIIFKYSLSAGYAKLYDFPTGASPSGGLVQGVDGNYYGVAAGHIFSMTAAGAVTNLAAFTTADGEQVEGGLVQANDGNLYGTAFTGGSYSGGCCGTVFKYVIGTNTLSLLYSFSETPPSAPLGALAVGTDGKTFYVGTDLGGGDQDNSGTIVSVNESGAEDTLYSFQAPTQEQPQAPLFLAKDGNFYGVTSYGYGATSSDHGTGTFFVMTPAGALTTLYDFDSTTGSFPYGGVVQGADGNFYGVTAGGMMFQAVPSVAVAPPVLVTASKSSVSLGGSVTLTWSVANATSETYSQCFAHSTDPGWTGLKATTGTQSVTPPARGTYVYGLTCGGVESGYATVTAVSVVNTTTTLQVLTNPVQLGQTESLQVSVAPASGSLTPTGKVTVYADGTAVASGSLSGGEAFLLVAVPNSIAPGTYSVTAKYGGDANDNPSTSAATSVVVQKAATTTTMSGAPNPVSQGSTCTLTATVATADGTAGGTVTFYFGGDKLGTGTLSGGTAHISAGTGGVPKGTYGITAKYSGDGVHAASTSAVTDVTVD